ncbi:MAG TPA: hypothetical protein VGG85_06475 [Terracidiphilus sp.]|jgi:hypothetical protein
MIKDCKTVFIVVVLCLTFSMGTARSHAQIVARHPAYLHALGDLRVMRAYLDQMTSNERLDEESQRAISEIDAAIREIRKAAAASHTALQLRSSVDVRVESSDRFHRAHDAGTSVWLVLDREEGNRSARGAKHRAIEHVERASRIIEEIMRRFHRK